MPEVTRRQALLAAVSGVATLAGCASDSDPPTVDPTIDRRSGNRPIEDYDVRRVRNENGAVLFAPGEELPTVTDGERGRYARAGRSVIVSEDDVADLTFGDAPEAEQLRTFVTATDFESSSLYLFAMPVDACYEIHLQSVTVDRGELDAGDLHPYADFCRTYRPADFDCGIDEIHTLGFAIRLPVAAEGSSGSGRSMSSSCRSSPGGEYFDATVTPANGGEGE